MNKMLMIGGGIAFLIVLIFGVYFFARGNKPESKLENLITQKNNLQGAITLAENKLNKEREILDILTKGLQSSFPLAVSVQEQMKKSSEIVKQTDFMFINPYGSKPELIVKNPLAGISINNERRDINLLLLEWRKKVDLLSAEEINVNESEKIKQDAQIIKSFINDLSKVVKHLTPENSGLSKFQIETYSSRLPSIETINEVLTSIETAIENSNTNNLQTNTEVANKQISPSSELFMPIVTPNDVIAQQSVVAETQNQVVVLQEQLAQIEVQIQQSSSIPTPIPTPTPAPTSTTINFSTENPNTNTVNAPENLPTREIINNQGIIIQPGPPRLIQGTDAY